MPSLSQRDVLVTRLMCMRLDCIWADLCCSTVQTSHWQETDVSVYSVFYFYIKRKKRKEQRGRGNGGRERDRESMVDIGKVS